MTKPIWVFAGPASKKIIYVPDEVADRPADEGWGQRFGVGKLTPAQPAGPHKKAEAFLAEYGPTAYRTRELRPEQNPAPEQSAAPEPESEPAPAPAKVETEAPADEPKAKANEKEAPAKAPAKKRR